MTESIKRLCCITREFRRHPKRLESIASFNKAAPMEKALVKDLVRNLFFIEYLGNSYIHGFQKFPRDFQALFITGCFEILFAHNLHIAEIIAAILKIGDSRSHNRALKKVLHGSLARIEREKEKIFDAQYPLSVRYSYPDCTFNILHDSIHPNVLSRVLQAMQFPYTGLGFLYNPHIVSRRQFIGFLDNNSCNYIQSSLHSDYIIVHTGTDIVLDSPLYRKGGLYIQDLSMVLLADYIAGNISQSGIILDYCAAPGGKTVALAQFLWHLSPLFICHDISIERLKILKKNLEKRPWINALTVSSSACGTDGELSSQTFLSLLKTRKTPSHLRAKIWYIPGWEEISRRQFDTVVVDAPCSGLGTLYKFPEIKYLFKDDAPFIRQQKNLLEKVKEFVKIQGNLYYLTCTLNKRENEGVFESFVQSVEKGWTIESDKNRGRKGPFTIVPRKGQPSGGYLAGMIRRK